MIEYVKSSASGQHKIENLKKIEKRCWQEAEDMVIYKSCREAMAKEKLFEN